MIWNGTVASGSLELFLPKWCKNHIEWGGWVFVFFLRGGGGEGRISLNWMSTLSSVSESDEKPGCSSLSRRSRWDKTSAACRMRPERRILESPIKRFILTRCNSASAYSFYSSDEWRDWMSGWKMMVQEIIRTRRRLDFDADEGKSRCKGPSRVLTRCSEEAKFLNQANH